MQNAGIKRLKWNLRYCLTTELNTAEADVSRSHFTVNKCKFQHFVCYDENKTDQPFPTEIRRLPLCFLNTGRLDQCAFGLLPTDRNQWALTHPGKLHSFHFHRCVSAIVIALRSHRWRLTEFRDVNSGERHGSESGGGHCCLFLGTFDCRIVYGAPPRPTSPYSDRFNVWSVLSQKARRQ